MGSEGTKVLSTDVLGLWIVEDHPHLLCGLIQLQFDFVQHRGQILCRILLGDHLCDFFGSWNGIEIEENAVQRKGHGMEPSKRQPLSMPSSVRTLTRRTLEELQFFVGIGERQRNFLAPKAVWIR